MIADAKVGVDARPRPPNKAELIAAAYQALGLPSEEQSSEYGLAHFLGAVTIERNDAALDAVLELWIRRVRADLKAWRRQAPPDWRHQPRNYMLSPEKARCNFYLFHEYQRVVGELQKQTGGRTPPLNVIAYERFLTVYRRLEHSPDRTGYKVYREAVALDTPAGAIFSFEEYKEACRVIESGLALSPYGRPFVAYDCHVRERFTRVFDARVHTPDRRGYRRYLSIEASSNIRRFIKKRVPICLPEQDRKLNSYIFASPGSGKSELLKLLVHAEVSKPPTAAVIVFDVASDFATQLRFREFAEDDSRLVYVDPYLDYDFTPTINPFEISRKFTNLEQERHEKDRLSAEITTALEQMLTDQGGVLTPNMQAVLSLSARALLDIPGATFEHLLQLMSDEEGAELRAECVRRATSVSAADFLSSEEAVEQSKRSREAIASKLRATFLRFDAFRHLTCGPTTIPLERLIEERKIIIFNLAKGETTKPVALAFGRFVLAAINALGFRRARISPDARTPTHVIIDEFQNFVTDTVFENIEELRKFGIMQTLVQPTLFGQMNKEQRKAFLNGVQGARFFGKCDPGIADYVAELAGGIDPTELIELSESKERIGEFFVRTKGRPTFLLHGDTRLLKTRNTLSEAEWEPLRLRQLERYYRPKEDALAADLADEEDTTEEVPADDASEEPETTAAKPSPKPTVGATQKASPRQTKNAKSAKPKRPPRKPPTL